MADASIAMTRGEGTDGMLVLLVSKMNLEKGSQIQSSAARAVGTHTHPLYLHKINSNTAGRSEAQRDLESMRDAK